MIPKSAKKFFNKAALSAVLAFSTLTGLAAGGTPQSANKNPSPTPTAVTQQSKESTRLGKKDAVIADLLNSATVVASDLIVMQGEKNNGEFDAENIFENEDGETYDAALDPAVQSAFSAAYDASWAKNKNLIKEERELKAFEAGGKAVVRLLLEGKDPKWTVAYTDGVVADLDTFNIFCSDNHTSYKAMRHDIYAQIGNGVATDIRLTPEELLGKNADVYISKIFLKLGVLESQFPISTKACTTTFEYVPPVEETAEEETRPGTDLPEVTSEEKTTEVLPLTRRDSTNETVTVAESSSYLPYTIPLLVILGGGGILAGGAAYGRHRARKRLSSYRR